MELRIATTNDVDTIWNIIEKAKLRRKLEGSLQWQDGYPNFESISNDVQKNNGFVLVDKKNILVYGALIYNYEPDYQLINGNWLNQDPFFVIHRVAVAQEYVGRGFATIFFQKLESYCAEKNVHNIKVDTNFDNAAMLHILKKLEYKYCGEVMIRGNSRKAFQKIITSL